MAEEKTMWGFIWENERNASAEVTLCDNKEEAVEEIQKAIRMDCQYLESLSDYYLVKVEKVEKFYLPDNPEILRKRL